MEIYISNHTPKPTTEAEWATLEAALAEGKARRAAQAGPDEEVATAREALARAHAAVAEARDALAVARDAALAATEVERTLAWAWQAAWIVERGAYAAVEAAKTKGGRVGA